MDTKEHCLEIIQIMSEIIDLIENSCVTPDQVINTFIDGFLNIKMEIESNQKDEKIDTLFCNIEEILTLIVDAYNNVKLDDIEILISSLLQIFPKWKADITNQLQYNIIICGINHHSPKFHMLLDKSKFNVIGYLNIPEIEISEDTLNGSRILQISDIAQINFDYIFIVSEFHSQAEEFLYRIVHKDKIINYYKHTLEFVATYQNLYSRNYEFSYLYSNLEQVINDSSVEVIFTGLSYTLHGIDCDLLSKKSVKLCWASQDLYYDYLLAKKAINNNTNLKQCVIGLAYFSFDFDLSKSKSQNYLIDKIYYPLLLDSHHYSLNEKYEHPLGIDRLESALSFPSPFSDISLMKSYITSLSISLNPKFNETLWNSPCENIPLDWLGKKRAQQNSKLTYPDSVIEYMTILENYLSMLDDNNIQPIIVIYPTSPLYHNNFDKTLKTKFYQQISYLQQKYKFSVHDFFESNIFDNSDFADCDHLNKKGASKMSLQIEYLLNKEFQ